MGRQVLALIQKELLAILRDARSRMVLIGPPLIQLMVFGYAASFDLNHVPVAIYDQDASRASAELVHRFTGSPTFTVEAMLHSGRRIDRLIDSRRVKMVLVIDRRFSRNLLTGRPARVQIIVDGRNSNTALVTEGYANTILGDFSAAWASAHGGPAPAAVLDLRTRYNPSLASRWFIVPGIVALLTQVVTLLVVALSVAREREMGTFDQLLVTPLRPVEILLGKALPGFIIGGLEAAFIAIVTILWFGVPFVGSVLALGVGLFFFLLAATGIGLMISSIAVTQQQGLLGVFMFLVPSIILSGFATPIANMPEAVQLLTYINPMRYFLIITRGVYLEGYGVSDLLPQYWPLALIGLVSMAFAAWLFRHRMD